MDRNRAGRNERVAAVFASTLPVTDYLLAPLKLTEKEVGEVRQELSFWFGRFVRRPSGDLPARHQRWALIWAALRLAYEIAELKGDVGLVLPHDPREIASKFGLEVEEPGVPES